MLSAVDKVAILRYNARDMRVRMAIRGVRLIQY